MLITALIFGLLGSFHCIGMCGPIAFLLPVDRQNPPKRVLQILSYHSGRLFTYGTIGLLFGFIGSRLDLFGFQQHISIAIGVLMILVILLPSNVFSKYNGSRFMYKWIGKIKKCSWERIEAKIFRQFFYHRFFEWVPALWAGVYGGFWKRCNRWCLARWSLYGLFWSGNNTINDHRYLFR